jgi:peptide chain release factor 2
VWRTCGGIFDVEKKSEELKKLEERAGQADFWNDANAAREVMRRATELKRVVNPWAKLNREAADLLELYGMASQENDQATLAELVEQSKSLEAAIAHVEFLRKLSGPDDASNAILTIHSGAGGTESCDWAEMLLRMYTRWMERKGFAQTLLDSVPGEGAGIKSATVEVTGEFAYGYLKAEAGVHRLVRISPFDANARRHTSFASVYTYPEIPETDDYELEDDDIRVDTYRASGAGGQHVNKTDSAVRMTHIPTNIVVQCQNERSQMKNRAVAIRMLKARVRQHYKEEEEKKRASTAIEKRKIDFGSQIRSYVLHPYKLVKDLRTDIETSNTDAVLDGDIDAFIEAYLLNFS